jgi:protein TonB
MKHVWAWTLLVSLIVHGALLMGVEMPQHSSGTGIAASTEPLTVVMQEPPPPAPMPAPVIPVSPPRSTPVKLSKPVKSAKPFTPDATHSAHSTAKTTASPVPVLDDLRSRSLQMARLDTQDPNAGRRVRSLTPQNRDTLFGPYEEAYGRKVESVGAVNYPPPVNGRALYGSVRLTATIGPDGQLVQVDIRTSSGSSDLDQAARRIVQMASPFQPFSEAMKAEADLVSITRTFNFVNAGSAISSGQ